MNERHRNKDIDITVLPKIFENSLICNCGRRDISAVQCVVGLKSEKLVKYGFPADYISCEIGTFSIEVIYSFSIEVIYS